MSIPATLGLDPTIANSGKVSCSCKRAVQNLLLFYLKNKYWQHVQLCFCYSWMFVTCPLYDLIIYHSHVSISAQNNQQQPRINHSKKYTKGGFGRIVFHWSDTSLGLHFEWEQSPWILETSKIEKYSWWRKKSTAAVPCRGSWLPVSLLTVNDSSKEL